MLSHFEFSKRRFVRFLKTLRTSRRKRIGARGNEWSQNPISAIEELERKELLSAPVASDDGPLDVIDVSAATLNLTGNDTMPNAGGCYIVIVTQPTHGSITPAGMDVSYDADDGFDGTDSFTYKLVDISDETPVESNVATVTMAVHALKIEHRAEDGIGWDSGTPTDLWISDKSEIRLNLAGATDIQWVIASGVKNVQDPDPSDHTYEITQIPAAELHQRQVSFYWVNIDGNVTVSGDYDGQSFEITKTYIIRRPDTYFGLEMYDGGGDDGIWIDSNGNLSYSDLYDPEHDPNNLTQGMQTVIHDAQAGASYGFFQRIDSTTVRARVNGSYAGYTGASIRDTPSTVSGNLIDSPSGQLMPNLLDLNLTTTPDVDFFSRSDNFGLFLMYKHNGPSGSVWVPIEFAQWSWGFTATKVNGFWELSNTSHTLSTEHASCSEILGGYPTWEYERSSLDWVWE